VSAGEAILLLSWPIDLELTVGSHGWAHLAPWSWDPEAGRLRRRERIGDELGIIEIAHSGPDSINSIIWDGFAPAGLPEIQRRARPWLSADWQPASALGEAPPERLGFDYLISLKGIGPYPAAHYRFPA
jgi:hypothetical protein